MPNFKCYNCEAQITKGDNFKCRQCGAINLRCARCRKLVIKPNKRNANYVLQPNGVASMLCGKMQCLRPGDKVIWGIAKKIAEKETGVVKPGIMLEVV